jgi:hypothetical protein
MEGLGEGLITKDLEEGEVPEREPPPSCLLPKIVESARRTGMGKAKWCVYSCGPQERGGDANVHLLIFGSTSGYS